MPIYLSIAVVLLFQQATAQLGESRTLFAARNPDTAMVFEPPQSKLAARPQVSAMVDAWGIDLLISGGGFGLGGFYRHQYSDDLYGTVSLAVSDAKDDKEVEQIDWWGQTFVPGKVNRFLLVPIHVGIQYRLFSDDIMDNFRPYVNAGLGPTIVFSSPYEKEFFSSLGSGQAHYTAGAYIGIGAFFGSEKKSLSGINLRYYFIPFSSGLPSLVDETGRLNRKTEFGGFFITLNFGSLF
ncbi:MAG: hypothetical protein NTV54_11955 [Ignavibacteriales bacterium]|nr:hypothetical protein [Ignavibacteriales bacterium]